MPSNVVRLRTMKRVDADALADLLRRVWYAEGDPGTQTVAARADLEFCMARATAAVAVECDGRPAGVCLARIDGGGTRPLPINRHHITACRSMLRLLRSAEGRRSASELVKLGVEGMMLSADARRQGRTYQAEVILLILDPSLQGTGSAHGCSATWNGNSAPPTYVGISSTPIRTATWASMSVGG